MKDILIIGGGWLGKPLAHYLESIGNNVIVTRTSNDGVSLLKAESLQAKCLDLCGDLSHIAQTVKSTKTNIVIGCFPPGFRSALGDQYIRCWETLTKACLLAQVKRIVMVSSTSVYPNLAKPMLEDDASWSKAAQDNNFSQKATAMLQAEQHVIDSGINYAIVRCSGLVGPDRHPSRFVSKMKQISTKAPANMLHLKDAIGVISFITAFKQNVIINATTPNTVSKAEFYQAALDSIGSEEILPPFVQQEDKRILSDHLEELGYRFHYRHTLELV
ncbi:NAD-dependent epimerase/dehydratase family protein [Vibrio pectenicida]|uniref:NAD-dependent epimerase/dehydratase family protein n=1 Tax=Vibrio pectenicida TaxID=62763 RepID=A0A427U3G1_9VIBR|nr:NAD-dependent epimerase/dehydratase family protein [Vibrio pectenicida]RSD31232.1 NAD-dependent epimerase/dehydratase family protein [Vibrio pectenicida]